MSIIHNSKKYSFEYKEYSSVDELPEPLRNLSVQALRATKDSYSPYSGFAVGAAVLLNNEEVILGSNQENGAYPSGLCAERVALFYASSTYPKASVKAIAIAAMYNGKTIDEPIAPCGACRQVMIEIQEKAKQPFAIVMVGKKRVVVVENSAFLLPFTFSNVQDAAR